MKSIKNLPIYVLSGALIFVGIASASQAQAAWTSKEISRVKALETKVQQLEKQLGSQELVTVRYLATDGDKGVWGDICPGDENLEGENHNSSYIGRLAPKTDIFGRPVTDIRGESISAYVYTCKIQFYAKKKS